MKQTRLALTGTAAVALVAWLLAVPASAQKVAGGGDGGSKGSSAPAPAPSAPSGGSGGGAVSSGSSGGTSSGSGYSGGYTRGGNDGGSKRDGSTGSSGYASPRGGSKDNSGSSGASGKGSSGATGGYTGGTVGTAAERGGGRKPFGEGTPKTNPTGDGVPAYSRPPRDGEPVGTAVPRGTTPRPPTGTTGIFIPGYYGGYGYYDPWGYDGGYGYYGGYYDPWYGGYPAYPVGGSTSSNDDEGSLRLKIKPREAEVYVDGYFVGTVDDFDGIFQRLHLDSGPHRIEVRAPGYETLDFEVRITPDHTTTYQGELKKIQ
jgi:PEGA domain